MAEETDTPAMTLVSDDLDPMISFLRPGIEVF
jgi:hypothetical protein